MFRLFETRRCDLCGVVLRRNAYVWQIDGRERRLCPGCSSRYERKASKAAFDAGRFHADKAQPFVPSPFLFFGGTALFLLVLLRLAGINPTTPSVERPVQSAQTHVLVSTSSPLTTVEESQRTAIRQHPQLASSGSTFNRLFLARLATWKATHDSRLDRSDWPERLADDCAANP